MSINTSGTTNIVHDMVVLGQVALRSTLRASLATVVVGLVGCDLGDEGAGIGDVGDGLGTCFGPGPCGRGFGSSSSSPKSVQLMFAAEFAVAIRV